MALRYVIDMRTCPRVRISFFPFLISAELSSALAGVVPLPPIPTMENKWLRYAAEVSVARKVRDAEVRGRRGRKSHQGDDEGGPHSSSPSSVSYPTTTSTDNGSANSDNGGGSIDSIPASPSSSLLLMDRIASQRRHSSRLSALSTNLKRGLISQRDHDEALMESQAMQSKEMQQVG